MFFNNTITFGRNILYLWIRPTQHPGGILDHSVSHICLSSYSSGIWCEWLSFILQIATLTLFFKIWLNVGIHDKLSRSRESEAAPNNDSPSTILHFWDDVVIIQNASANLLYRKDEISGRHLVYNTNTHLKPLGFFFWLIWRVLYAAQNLKPLWDKLVICKIGLYRYNLALC